LYVFHIVKPSVPKIHLYSADSSFVSSIHILTNSNIISNGVVDNGDNHDGNIMVTLMTVTMVMVHWPL